MKARAVVLLCGDPRSEEKRKRLPAGFLAKLHRDLSARLAARGDLQLLLGRDVDDRFELRSGNETITCTTQRFAEKVDLAFSACFERGASEVVVIAGDVAGLQLELIDAALGKLDSSDARAVLGPSGDGGLYLLGLNRAASDLRPRWDEVEWFSTATRVSVERLLERYGCEASLLPRHDDIDDANSALSVARTLAGAFRELGQRLLALLMEIRWFALEPVLIDARSSRAGVRHHRPPPR